MIRIYVFMRGKALFQILDLLPPSSPSFSKFMRINKKQTNFTLHLHFFLIKSF
ncbi:hypothetical protein NBO_38g0033 [Nosema bombycis CQ1]|uniref:Uncharacterized protein n=1 Tax=Nosema bombycis (strain CQ1 / CVCC 102059) TaxID=578461 RepID=R0M7Z9_NOSB1|nr:hypothetical protein NBO_38g0033 [Nosema bombycis CQ1]|eukprot:EOB14124.1 hypothetical protein NBO_38g0033 [Nosema bombycis CQ1]